MLRNEPDNRAARQALERAKLRSSAEHYARARRFSGGGRLDEALVELQLATELNPADKNVADALEIRTQRSCETRILVARDGKTGLETLIDRTRNMAPQGQELPTDVKLPASLTFRDAPSRDVFTAVARFANISVTFDPQFRDQPVTIDLRETTLENALQALSASTRSFYRVTGPRFITVVPDTAAKRQEYEEEIVRTFPLSNADLKETVDLLRIVIDARRLAPVTATNTIAIKDTPARVAAAGTPDCGDRQGQTRGGHRRRASRSRSHAHEGIRSADRVAWLARDRRPGRRQSEPNFTLRDLRSLTQSGVFLTNVPALFYRLLKQDSNTRTLANPQLRSSEGMPAQARFGERVPVPVTTFSPIATGGVAQQPITSFNYENIGVNIDITPRTHHDDEVSLALKIEVSSISGTGFGDLPTFGNRSISTVIRLHDGETNLLAGLIRDDERVVRSGDGRAERHTGNRSSFRPHQTRDAGNRYRPHADAAHRPRPRSERRGPAAVPRRTRRRRRYHRRRRRSSRCRCPSRWPLRPAQQPATSRSPRPRRRRPATPPLPFDRRSRLHRRPSLDLCRRGVKATF